MINCIIIDDEQPARDTLGLLISSYFSGKVRVTGTAESLREGVLLINRQKPDLVFLDIELQDENGLNIYRYFQDLRFSVVFTTAYKDYAINAVKESALDYILKPVGIEAIREALDLYEKRKLSDLQPHNIEKLLSRLGAQALNPSKIALPTIYGFHVEKIDSIIYCEADQNYTKLHNSEGETFIISKPLNSVQSLLPADIFFRIHKSYLVNLNYVKTYSRYEGFHITLDNGKKLDVATRRNDEFVKVMTNR